MADVTETDVRAELDAMDKELTAILEKATIGDPSQKGLQGLGEFYKVSDHVEQRRKVLLALRGAWIAGEPERKVPPLQQELGSQRHGLGATAKLLLRATEDCEATMEHPGHDGVSARVIGDVLDNVQAGGVESMALMRGEQDFVVVFERNIGEKTRRDAVNLANVVALARIGAQSLLGV